MNDDDMIVRDLFAMFALAGLLIAQWDSSDEEIAETSYSLADAMIKARDPKKGLPAIQRKKK